MMTSSKKPVACTVSFLSDETKHKFEVWIRRQGADGGFEERKRFAELESALAWASTALQGQVEAFREERRQFEQLKETASPRDRAIYFVTDPSQLPEAERMRRRREAAIAARTRQVGGHTFRFISVIEPERDRAESVRAHLKIRQ